MNKLTKIFKRGPHYLKVYGNLSGEDILLVSFPKSGNTWVRNILANYIGINDLGKEKITFKELDDTLPGLGTDVFFKPWNFSIPKFSATHFKYFFFFKRTRNILILRDPRDVMVSYYFYINKKKNNYSFESLYDLMIHPTFGLENWFKHTRSWYKKVDFIMVYEELLEADTSIMKEMFQKFDIVYNEDNLDKAIENSRFKNFKKIEQTYGHSKPNENKEGFSFARKGESGDYKNHFDERCYKLYNQLLEVYGFKSYTDIIDDFRNHLKK